MAFRTYFYSLKDDNEIYHAQYQSDCGAEASILDIYGSNVLAIWRPERTLYEDVSSQMPEVQGKRRRRARGGASR